MKKISTILALAALALSANAQDVYTVYSDGALGANIIWYGWWQPSVSFDAENPDGEGKVLKFCSETQGAAFSGGLDLVNKSGSGITTGNLNSATLEFDWYAVGTGFIDIRLTGGVEQNYRLTLTDENTGKWNHVAWVIEDAYPEVAAAWKADKNDGEGYVFGMAVDGADATTAFYFNNIVYTNVDSSWTAPDKEDLSPKSVPTPDVDPADVVNFFCNTYGADAPFAWAGWGQATAWSTEVIDGKSVWVMKHFNYQGFDINPVLDVTSCNYLHVDMYTPNATAFGCSIINAGLHDPATYQDTVKLNEWNSYDIPLSFFTEQGVELDKIDQMKFDQGFAGDCEVYVANVFFYHKEESSEPDPVIPDDPSDAVSFGDSVQGSVKQQLEGQEEKTYNYTLSYTIVYNSDKTLTVSAIYDWENNEAPVGIVDGSVFINNQLNDFSNVNGKRTVTTTTTYTAGDVIPLNFYIPMALGVVETPISYTVGESNDYTSAISTIGNNDNIAPVYYNLQGVRVDNPEKGLYIRIQGNKSTKVIL